MLALAFTLVTLAGACTGIGASLVFCKCVTKSNERILAGALGFSAGVMLYVTFIEIFQKSLEGFVEAGLSEGFVEAGLSGTSYAVATITFFSGLVLMYLIEKLVERLRKNEDELSKMGFMTALAIAIHNFPEGIATFVATLRDPSFGIVMAFAIGIHNIPEGMCVSIPLFYASDKRCKPFLWALLSGASEPIGALLAYMVIDDSPLTFGIVFGLVAGMMTYVCLRELIPTAHRYDPKDELTTSSIVAGMAVMALSLVGFSMEPSGKNITNLTSI
jgi:ZIP family zinc transporter